MSRRRGFLFLVCSLSAAGFSFTPAASAALTSARAKTLQRFKKQCDDEGEGKACYDYGRALWSTPGAIDRKTAKRYLLRGCELDYKLACETYKDHSSFTTRTHHHRRTVSSEENHGSCFTTDDLGTARFASNVKGSRIEGQRIDDIKPNSFWAHVGLKDDDVIVKVNNMPFNTTREVLNAFAKSGKKFGFEVQRENAPIVLWYTCQ